MIRRCSHNNVTLFRYVQDAVYVTLTQVLSLISCNSDKGRILTGFTMNKSVFLYGLKWIESIENGQSLSIDNYGYKPKALQIILNTSWLKRFYCHQDAESF